MAIKEYTTRNLLVATTLIAFCSGTIIGIHRLIDGPTIPDRLFDEVLWKEEYESWRKGPSRTQRSRMILDLIKSQILIGKTKETVVDLLGDPDAMFARRKFPDWDLIYYVGLERQGKLALDNEYLLVRLDVSGLVSDVSTSVD